MLGRCIITIFVGNLSIRCCTVQCNILVLALKNVCGSLELRKVEIKPACIKDRKCSFRNLEI